ncbi:MAG TPA: CDP-alcohol phosphatidyltransferase family protein [Gammaproteobacteria bacterium]|nr:CDP-alcohol phosphatidyltransferase family protein [Gammaproteobacteria bacterium]
MATIYDLKPAFQNLLRPLVGRLAAAGVTANQVTLAALALSLLTAAGLAAWPASRVMLLLVPLVLFLRMALNAIDGMLAREYDMKTPLGAVLNELGDVISDAALYGAFALVPGLSPLLVVLAVLLALISEMTGVIGVQIGASRRYDGPMGKSDRAFVFGVLALAGGLGIPLAGWSDWLLGLVCGLLVLTILNRARAALAELG